VLSGLTDRFDAYQQRHAVPAVAVSVARRYQDQRGSWLASALSHAGFLAVFPMVLVLVTLTELILRDHNGLRKDVLDSALHEFPVIGPDLERNLHQLPTGDLVALVIGLLWLVYGSLRLSRASLDTIVAVWGLDRDAIPGAVKQLPRSLGFLVVLGIGFIAGGALAGVGTTGRLGVASAFVGILGTLVVNVAMYWVGLLVLIRLPKGDDLIWPGAVVGGVCWTILQTVGVLLIEHQLRHLSNLYGTFATVLGFLGWVGLGAMATVLAAEVNVVLGRRQWPRSLRSRLDDADPEVALTVAVGRNGGAGVGGNRTGAGGGRSL
jgi:uncharacterized BrkB/YihY/UPF0761 family membrane protein